VQLGDKLIVIGAGPMGLAAAYQAVKRGYDVEVLEAGDRVGGMAAHFDFDGLSIERFYHFCCLSDHDTFELLDELGLAHTMKWVSTRMGFYVDGKLYRWGDPLALLTFPKIDLISKIRYGLQVFLSTKRSDWRTLDRVSAKAWFIAWSGQKAYDRLWKPLLELKFFELSDNISAAWIWQRIKRLGKSRKSLFEERLGYIEGGSETLVNALAAAIQAKGGRIHLNTPASRILIADGAVTGVEANSARFGASKVISTIATPYVSALLADAPEAMRQTYARIGNVGVVCVIHKLARSVSPNFWVNISDSRFDIPGIVEFSNLRPVGGETIVYVPYYMPQSHPKFSMSDEALIEESWAYLKLINPALTDADRLASRAGRLRYAQPVCEVGFAALIPPAQTPIRGLQIADTCFYYPEDRGISESAGFAKRLVEALETAS
jgi:protoporphyrinogen oxidase